MAEPTRRSLRCCFAAGILLCLASASALAGDATPPPRVMQAFQRLQRSAENTWSVEWNRHGQVESLRGRSPVLSTDPEAAAATFLTENGDLFELQRNLGDLEVSHFNESLSGTHISYDQIWHGLPVFGGGLDVHVSKAGEVFLVNNRYAKETALSAVASGRLSEADAIQAATAAHETSVQTDKLGRRIAPGTPSLMAAPVRGVYRGASGLVISYRLTVGGVLYIVSAEDGAILKETPLARHVNGTGRVFNPNPVNTLRNRNLRDQGDADFAAIQGAYQTKALRDIKQLTGPVRYQLTGPYVRMFDATAAFFNSTCPLDVNAHGAAVQKVPPIISDPSFSYGRGPANFGFEHTNVYFHLDRSQRYIQRLGFSNLLNNGIAADAHAFEGDNSFFCPASGGYLAFGDGGVDDAEDADVILHEYGHALQYTASNGRYGSDGQSAAMGEGFGDYWAFQAKPTGFRPACFAEWDANGEGGGCLRRLKNSKRFPDDYLGGDQFHADSEIWSAALRDIFVGTEAPEGWGDDTEGLRRNESNKIVLESHFLVDPEPKFIDGANALLVADEEIHGRGANSRAICMAMMKRGIIDYHKPSNQGYFAADCPITIEGHVQEWTDSGCFAGSGGSPIAGAIVSTSLDSGASTADGDGHFLLQTNSLADCPTSGHCDPTFEYSITVSAPGFIALGGAPYGWGHFAFDQIFCLCPVGSCPSPFGCKCQ